MNLKKKIKKNLKRKIKKINRKINLKKINTTEIIERIIDLISSTEKNKIQSKIIENILKILFLSSSFIYSLPISFSAKLISLPLDFLIALILSCYYAIQIARKNNIDIKEEKRNLASFIADKVILYIIKNNISLKIFQRRGSIALSIKELMQRSKIAEDIENLFKENYRAKNK